MKGRNFTISLIIALTYWILSSIALADTINGTGTIFPFWIDLILMPVYILGFALGFGGGNFWAIIGQIITLIILFFIARAIHEQSIRKNT